MEFLFDDKLVDRKAGVQRTLGKPRKEIEPILKPIMPWEGDLSGSGPVLFDSEEQRFKMWYRASMATRTEQALVQDEVTPSSERGSGGHRNFICYAESNDGVQWVRPNVGLFEFEGSRENNILSETKGVSDGPLFNVVKDPEDPDPGRRYKALGFDWCVTSAVRGIAPGTMGVCVAYSADGLRWTPPKLVVSTHDMTDADCVLAHREPTSGKWVAFLRPRTHPKRRFIGYAVSDDFDHWTYPRMLLTPDIGDDEWIEFYGLTAAAFDSWRVGSLWVYHNNPTFSPMTNELVYSRDGVHYHRAMPGTEFLPLGSVGDPDSRMVHPIAIIERGGECFLYYQGTNREHGSDRGMPMQEGRHAKGEVLQTVTGLARLPWGHFCGLHATLDGMIETQWLCNYGNDGLKTVAAVMDEGSICAELLDQYGALIPGWGCDESRIHADEFGRLRFSWGRDELIGTFGQTSEAGGKIGHVLKIRFHLHKATLFGFQLGDSDAMPPYVG